MSNAKKIYLGDGLYVYHDGMQYWLTTDAGMEVALEPSVLGNFFKYIEKTEGLKITTETAECDHEGFVEKGRCVKCGARYVSDSETYDKENPR